MADPAAPLEKAVEAYRRALDKVHHFDRQGDSGICGDESHVAGEALLAALDADPHITCDCGRPRLSGPCSGSCDNDE